MNYVDRIGVLRIVRIEYEDNFLLWFELVRSGISTYRTATI